MEPAAAAGRAEARATPGEDRFERKGAQDRLRESFLAIAAAEPARCRVIHAARDPEAVAADIWQAVAARLEPA
jgi:dTMP kinase